MSPTGRLNQARNERIVAIAVTVVALVVLSANARFASALPVPPTPHNDYVRQIVLLFHRYDVSIAALDQVLTRRDVNPGLVGSAEWLQQDAGISQELQIEYRDAAALMPPAGDGELQACVADGLRLTASGATMLHDGFLTDGHGAYYLGAHGNWNLNLGRKQIQRCRSSLAGSSATTP